MSWLDSRLEEEVQLHKVRTKLPDGTEKIKYAYGPPLVAISLIMDDVAFDTPEEAVAWWEGKDG